jgi:hypothetical protein
MSIDRRDYLVTGYKLPGDFLNDYDEEILLPYIEGRQGLEYRIIADSMCGEYVVFGYVHSSSSSDVGWDFVEINIECYNDNILKQFHSLFFKEPDVPLTTFIFSEFC